MKPFSWPSVPVILSSRSQTPPPHSPLVSSRGALPNQDPKPVVSRALLTTAYSPQAWIVTVEIDRYLDGHQQLFKVDRHVHVLCMYECCHFLLSLPFPLHP